MFTFKGRGTRREFIIQNLFSFLIIVAIFLIKSKSSEEMIMNHEFLNDQSSLIDFKNIFTGIILISFSITAIIIPFFEASRRLHDLNKNGLFSLILLVPFIGFIVFIYLIFTPGTKGTNRFGENPRYLQDET